ncbi:MAG: ethylbenzene dehydrogenase-related protein [Myxococcota bacterium]|nr:ethylbenzene dehydrogenase-related protein [Myxococcota bacterium]
MKTGEAVSVARAEGSLDTPDAPGWSGVPEHRIDLQPAPPVHPSLAFEQPGVTPAPLFFRVASDAERLWVRLRWSDATLDSEDAFDRFPDAVALQFALQAGERTSPMMGSPDAPVNIWYWKASTSRAEDLAAGGFGSLTRLSPQDVSAASAYEEGSGGGWSVVLSRAFEASGEHRAAFGPGASVPVAFAVWQGARAQRDGNKLVTLGWVELRFGGAPEDAPLARDLQAPSRRPSS